MKQIDIDLFQSTPWTVVRSDVGEEEQEKSLTPHLDPRSPSYDVRYHQVPVGTTRLTKVLPTVDGRDATLAIEVDWAEERVGDPAEAQLEPVLRDFRIIEADEPIEFADGEGRWTDFADDRGVVEEEFETIVYGNRYHGLPGLYDEMAYPPAARQQRAAAAPPIGTIVTDVEGYDLGPDGAVVVENEGNRVDLLRLDTEELLKDVLLSPDSYHAEEPPKAEGIDPWGYDESALGRNPEQHSIRVLPTYWGPRDPNNPSSLTDVSWRPEPYWRRMLHRYYDPERKQTMTIKRAPRFRRAERRRAARRTAEPLFTMEPIPRPMGAVMPPDRRMQLDNGLPGPMRVNRWKPGKDDAFDTEALVAHTVDFWQQYRTKRYSYMSEIGDRRNMELRDWALMYQAREGLERPEMDLLYRFMVATALIPRDEYHEWQDLLDTYQVFRYHRS